MTGLPDQIAYWNGEVGQRWAQNQRALDAAFTPLTDALFEGIDLPLAGRILDIGCGAGETALRAAAAVGPRGQVLAADISAPLLDVARERAAAAGASITFVEADAEAHDFGSDCFDRAISRFGVMFFADSQAAFANLRRTLKPGGALVFLCWQSIAANAWVSVPRDVVLRLIPDVEPAPPDAPGPFRFAERATIEVLLAGAGFTDVAIEPVERPLTLGRSADGCARMAAEAAAAFAVGLGPVTRLLRDREPAIRDDAFEAVARAFEPLAHEGTVALGSACWLVRARR